MKICFVGLDGSGKSTQSKILLDRLCSSGFDAVYRHQFRYESDKIMSMKDNYRPFIKACQFLFCIEDSILLDNSFLKFVRDNFLWRVIRFPFKYIVGFLVAYSGLRKSIEKNLKFGDSDYFIMDRCFLDEVARIEWKLSIKLPFRSIFFKLAPHPDITIYFDIPGDISWDRMDPKDTSLVPMILKQAKYRELLPVYSSYSNVELINIYGDNVDVVEKKVQSLLENKYGVKTY